jgi:hypothetical protein
MTRTPIFLLSMPRAGSTLVQRVLAAHPDVETVAEPWIFLPHAYALRERGIAAEYTHPIAVRAVREFVDRFPDGVVGYREALRSFVLDLYERAAPGPGRYFVDKTPRYHFVVEELFATFPDARFVFLWRNPLSVVASIVETWCRGRWNVDRWRADLLGLARLVDASVEHADRSITVRYEDLVAGSREPWARLFGSLDLSFEPELLERFSEVRLVGSMGDPTGVDSYDRISSEPSEKWRRTLASPWRRRWCARYLDAIGDERLRTMGYEPVELRAGLDALERRMAPLVSDVVHGVAWSALQARKRMAFRWAAPRVRSGPTASGPVRATGTARRPG